MIMTTTCIWNFFSTSFWKAGTLTLGKSLVGDLPGSIWIIPGYIGFPVIWYEPIHHWYTNTADDGWIRILIWLHSFHILLILPRSVLLVFAMQVMLAPPYDSSTVLTFLNGKRYFLQQTQLWSCALQHNSHATGWTPWWRWPNRFFLEKTNKDCKR